jgi:hypothetical protein
MYKHQTLLHLTDREIHNLLMKRGIRGKEAQDIREEVAQIKREIRSKNARRRMVQGLWQTLIEPLTNEQRSVRAMLHYESQKYPNPQRREALNGYAKLLAKLKLKLREHRHYAERTPKEQAEYMASKGKPIPNEGKHWTDWVPEQIKHAVIQAFAEIPRAAKARVKDPFPRTMTKADNLKLRAAHIKTAKRELLEAEQELTLIRELNKGEPSEAERDAQAKVKHTQNILNWLICAEDNEIVPRTWGELYVAELPVVKLDDAPAAPENGSA